MNLKSINKYFFFLFFLIQFSSYAQEPIVLDKIIGKVGNNIILKSTLERTYLDYLSQGSYTGGDLKCRVLGSLFQNKLMAEKAVIDSVEVSDAEVNATLDQRISYIISNVGSEEELEAYYGKTIEEFKEELFDQLKEQLLIQNMQRQVVSDIKVTPAEIKRFYKRIPSDSLPFYSAEVSIAHIVMTPEANDEEKQRVKDLLLDMRSKIMNGEAKFEELAKKYSEDPGSGAKGGELGLSKRGQLVPPFEAMVFSLEKGEISEPVESDFGFHMIQLHERLGNSYRSRHILIKPKPTYEDFLRTEARLDSLSGLIRKDSLSFEAVAKEYSEDQRTSSSGGFFVDQTGAQRMSVEELPPELFFTIDTMKIGTISKPYRFNKQDGTEALRVLYYKDRIPPHQANLKQDYHKLQSAVKESKKSSTLNAWLKEAKKEVFTEIDPEYSNCKILEN